MSWGKEGEKECPAIIIIIFLTPRLPLDDGAAAERRRSRRTRASCHGLLPLSGEQCLKRASFGLTFVGPVLRDRKTEGILSGDLAPGENHRQWRRNCLPRRWPAVRRPATASSDKQTLPLHKTSVLREAPKLGLSQLKNRHCVWDNDQFYFHLWKLTISCSSDLHNLLFTTFRPQFNRLHRVSVFVNLNCSKLQ